jgi:fibronectin type 3 domain-containing protein
VVNGAPRTARPVCRRPGVLERAMHTIAARHRQPQPLLSAVLAFAVVLAGLVVMAGPSSADQPEIRNRNTPMAIAGEYVVGFKPVVKNDEVEAKAKAVVEKFGGTIVHVWPAIRAFAVRTSEEQATGMAGEAGVEYVEQNQRAERSDTQAGLNIPWHLDRDDQPDLPRDLKFNYPLSNIPIYVIDSGARITHNEFDELPARVTAVHSTIPNSPADSDCRGHGTGVASVAGGKTYGVAKRSPIRIVKVDDCNSTGTEFTITDGILWVAANAPRPAVVNMSLGFRNRVASVDAATEIAARTGLTFVLAAGNFSSNTCNMSPQRVSQHMAGVIVVAAIDQTDMQADFADWGPCVTMHAPGVDIRMASHVANHLEVPTPQSGCSFAAPQVAGAAAMILTQHPNYSPGQVKAALLADASKDKILFRPNRPAANRLLYIPPPDQPAIPSSSDLNELFRLYGDQGGHWTGGDETVSVELGNGRVAWLFGDTYLGTVNADGSRSRNTPMIHNSIVVQQGNSLVQTLHGGTPTEPKSLVGAEDDIGGGHFGWWPGEGQVIGNELQVFYFRTEDGRGGPLSFVTKEIAIARFALPSLTLQGLTKLPALTPGSGGRGINWGMAMVDGTDNFTYIYGMETTNGQNWLHVARTPKGQLTNTSQWTFWTGSPDVPAQWSSSESSSRATTTGMGNGFSVKYLANEKKYVLVTMDLSQPFTNRLMAFYADAPTGPFRHPTLLYKAPEASSGRFVYNARVHIRGSDIIASYNVNSLDPNANFNDARLYRPRFVKVAFRPPLDASQLPAAPTNLVATSPADGRVRLRWTAPSGTNLKYWIYERHADSQATHFTRSQDPVTVTDTTFGVLKPGGYEYRVSAENAVGEGPPSLPASVSVSMPKPATAPTLTGNANADGSVGLSWTPVTASGIVGYRIYQRDVTAGQSDFTVSGAAPVGTAATVTGLNDGSVYEFKVAAFNGGGEGPHSNVVRLTATVPAPPAPTNLVASARGDGSIALTWNSSCPGCWYWIEMRNAGSGDFVRLQYPVSTGTAHTVTLLELGVAYEFRVVAIGTNGRESGPSNVASATTRRDPPPPPTNLTATPNNDATITLNWTAPEPGLWYWVYQRTGSSGEFTRSRYPVTTGTTFTVSFLTAGTTYQFRVTAVGPGDMESTPSNIAQATATAAPPPPPTNLTATANTDGTITLNWRYPGSGAWFWVYQRIGSTGEFTQSLYPVTTGTTHTAGFLTTGTRYEFRITAIGPGGVESTPSNIAGAVATIPPPAAPTNLRATPGNGQVTLTWNGPTNIFYWVYRRTLPNGSFVRSDLPVGNQTTLTVVPLTNGTGYEFYVTAVGAGGAESPPSNLAQAIPQMAPPGAPTNLTATANNDGTIRLSWTAPAGANLWYWVYHRPGTSGDFTRTQYPVTTGTTYTAAYLTLGTTYQFRVSAINAGGEGPQSNTAQAVSTIPPPPAPSLSAAGLSDGSVRLNWSAPAPGLLYWIDIRDVTAGGGWVRQRYPASATTFTATYLTLNRRYAFRVSAVNGGGVGPASNVVEVTSTIPPPANVRAFWSDHTQATVAWTAQNMTGMFWVYYRNGTSGAWTRSVYPVSGRAWASIRPLTASGSYQFYVTQIGHGGETAPSPVVTLAGAYPIPGPGGGSVTSSYGAITCSNSEYPFWVKVCQTTVTMNGSLTGWSTDFQYGGLHFVWYIRENGNQTFRLASCSGTTGITSCQRSAQYTVIWRNPVDAPARQNAPEVCVEQHGYANYILGPSGHLTTVSRWTPRSCFTPGWPPV